MVSKHTHTPPVRRTSGKLINNRIQYVFTERQFNSYGRLIFIITNSKVPNSDSITLVNSPGLLYRSYVTQNTLWGMGEGKKAGHYAKDFKLLFFNALGMSKVLAELE